MINKKILAYLKQERISQSELAVKTGIIQQNLNRLLKSKEMKVSQMLKITEALGLPTDYFLAVKESVNKESEKETPTVSLRKIKTTYDDTETLSNLFVVVKMNYESEIEINSNEHLDLIIEKLTDAREKIKKDGLLLCRSSWNRE
jgi:transcriptional regulator with XRE-family HTH domain